MTVADLLALPVGLMIRWDDPSLSSIDGEVIGRDADGLHVEWSDGEKAVLSSDDDGITELAGWVGIISPSTIVSAKAHCVNRVPSRCGTFDAFTDTFELTSKEDRTA